MSIYDCLGVCDAQEDECGECNGFGVNSTGWQVYTDDTGTPMGIWNVYTQDVDWGYWGILMEKKSIALAQALRLCLACENDSNCNVLVD